MSLVVMVLILVPPLQILLECDATRNNNNNKETQRANSPLDNLRYQKHQSSIVIEIFLIQFTVRPLGDFHCCVNYGRNDNLIREKKIKSITTGKKNAKYKFTYK